MTKTAVVIGASGGIGKALVEALVHSGRYATVHALARSPVEIAGAHAGRIDITEEATVRQAADGIESIDCLIVASGLLHGPGLSPERALRDLDPQTLAILFQVNAIGPAIVLNHFAPRLARDRETRTALISARVGSISDNRLGGWYGYRASKAALNMIVKCTAIELARSRPKAICVGLHPGTVDTALSAPFRHGVPEGRLLSADRSAAAMLAVLDGLVADDSGQCFAWDGAPIAA